MLGTGTSTGVPEVGCGCGTCLSGDSHDKRLRASVLLITDDGKRILIDCSPDFREQALRIGLDRLDAILLTHEHYDHIGGLDDLRTIAYQEELPIYGQRRVLESIKERLHYIFTDKPYPGAAKLSLNPIDTLDSFELLGLSVQPIEVLHGRLPVLGYRIGDFCYITDMKTIATEELAKVEGVRCLLINALRMLRPHPSHQTIKDVLTLWREMFQKPKLTLLTHLSHHAPTYKQLSEELPEGIASAYDGLVITMEKDKTIESKAFAKAQELFQYQDCGRIAYAEAWEMQHKIFDEMIAQKRAGERPMSQILFCEHNPVFTLGKHGKEENRLFSVEYLQEQGYDWFEVERGGDVTYHGPGQITGYPILDLEQFALGLKAYIDLLEDSVIELLAFYKIEATRKEGATGVWLDVAKPEQARKICAIGVRSSRYVTMHGFALNVNNDLKPFQLINPCGFVGGRVTSMQAEFGEELDFYTVKQQLLAIISKRLKACLGASL